MQFSLKEEQKPVFYSKAEKRGIELPTRKEIREATFDTVHYDLKAEEKREDDINKGGNTLLIGRKFVTLHADDAAYVRKQKETMPAGMPWAEDFPDAVIHTTRTSIESKHKEDFDKAKAGDTEAARRLVGAVVKPEKVLDIAEQYPNAIVAYPHAVEASGKNKIPEAYAMRFEAAGLHVSNDIYTINEPHHTGANDVTRLTKRARYGGEVEAGREYILVDDQISSGASLRDLKDYIEANGGKVVFVSGLTASYGGTKIAQSESTRAKLAKAGITDKQLQDYGIATSTGSLTNAEANRYARLANSRTNRGASEGSEGSRRVDEEQRVLQEGQGDVRPYEGREGSEAQYSLKDEPPYRESEEKLRNFKKFFGDWENDPANASKVVDEDGEPLPVYHWSGEGIDTFDLSRARTSMDVQGFFFQGDPESSREYGDTKYAVYLDMRNPYIVDSYEKSKKAYPDLSKTGDGIRVREELQAEGYDGIIRKADYMDAESDEYIVFEPTQIKSATENNGEYSKENGNIHYSLKEDAKRRMDMMRDVWKYGEDSKAGLRRSRTAYISDAEREKAIRTMEYLENIYGEDNLYRNPDMPIPHMILRDNAAATVSNTSESVHLTQDNVGTFLYGLHANYNMRDMQRGRGLEHYDEEQGRVVIDYEEAKKRYEKWSGQANSLRRDLMIAKQFATDAAAEEIQRHIDDIDYADKFYTELVNGRAVFKEPGEYTPMYDLKEESDATSRIVEDGNVQYSLVTDKGELDRLNSEKTIKVYRAMQIIDGKLYPPMSAKVDGKLREPIELGQWEQSEENPEKADDKGYFKLNKGNKKSVPARYNPYFHTSPTPLNDQFSEAQSRPNLVTVEVEIPESELTSGYKAEKAKDAVGAKQWKAGIIQGQLSGTREVILSRWDKPVRIVPDAEVAEVIKGMFGDKDITMPSNVVTPSLRAELEKLGVDFVETNNQGRLESGEHYSKVYGKNGSAAAVNGGKGADSIMPENVQPVGKSSFGSVYDQFKGKAKAAFKWLFSHKDGDMLGVFHHREIGDIDLVWGDKNGGLDHIIDKHVGEGKSFSTMEEAADVISDIISKGQTVRKKSNEDKLVLKLDTKQVTIRKNYRVNGKKVADKNWILTAYDEKAADGESAIIAKKLGPATRTTANSAGKGTNNSGSGKGNVQFSLKEEQKPVFYSNAERAVEGLKQEKATPEQWKSMMQKAGGLKAEEDKWMGLSEWLGRYRPSYGIRYLAVALSKRGRVTTAYSTHLRYRFGGWGYRDGAILALRGVRPPSLA